MRTKSWGRWCSSNTRSLNRLRRARPCRKWERPLASAPACRSLVITAARSRPWIVHNAEARHAWCDLAQNLDPLSADRLLQAIGEAGDITTRVRDAGDQAIADRIGHHHEDDRNRPVLRAWLR